MWSAFPGRLYIWPGLLVLLSHLPFLSVLGKEGNQLPFPTYFQITSIQHTHDKGKNLTTTHELAPSAHTD